MRDNYFFTITNPKKRYYTIIANILILISFILYSLSKQISYHYNTCNSVFFCIILPNIILLFFIVRFFYILKLKKEEFTNLHFSIVASICWASLHYWFPSIIILLLGILEYFINKDTFVNINKNGVQLKGAIYRKYIWENLQNVILKDGIFTIDQKNNKIFQTDISSEVIPFTEKELQEYISKRIVKS